MVGRGLNLLIINQPALSVYQTATSSDNTHRWNSGTRPYRIYRSHKIIILYSWGWGSRQTPLQFLQFSADASVPPGPVNASSLHGLAVAPPNPGFLPLAPWRWPCLLIWLKVYCPVSQGLLLFAPAVMPLQTYSALLPCLQVTPRPTLPFSPASRLPPDLLCPSPLPPGRSLDLLCPLPLPLSHPPDLLHHLPLPPGLSKIWLFVT